MNHFYFYYRINIYLLLIFIIKYKEIFFNQQIFTNQNSILLAKTTSKLFIYFVVRCNENGIEYFISLSYTIHSKFLFLFYYMYNILYKYNNI